MRTIALYIIILSAVLYSGHGYCGQCRIIYGIYDNYKPFEWYEAGVPKGINIELLKAVSEKAGCEYGFISRPWPEMLKMLENEEITMLSASMTPERLTNFIQLPPSFVQYRIFIARKGSGHAAGLSSLRKKTVLALKNSVAWEKLSKGPYDVKLIPCSSETDALKKLSEGSGDFAFVDDSSEIIEKVEKSGLIIASEPMFPTLYGFMMKQNSPYFSRLSKAAEELKATGQYYKIIERSKQYKYSRLTKIFLISAAVCAAVFSAAFLWIKSLSVSVRRKTKSLNKEICARINTEKMLREETEKRKKLLELLETVLKSIPESIFLSDENGKIVWSNRGETHIIPSYIKDKITDIKKSSGPREFSYEDADGRVWKILASDFVYGGKDGTLLVAGDITENIKLRNELFMTGRYSALGEMAAIIAHEINNPIGCIIHNFSYINKLIEKYGIENKDMDAAAEDISASVRKIASIISELKEYTGRNIKTYEKVSLKKCFRSAYGMTRFMINKYTRNFTGDIKDTANILGNYGQIEQMMINVIQNACYALTDKSAAIKCSLYESGNEVHFKVEDEGTGMDEDALKNACDPYFTTRRESGGTGIGLSLTSRFMKEHGGSLLITSEKGKGTSVTLSFPACKEP